MGTINKFKKDFYWILVILFVIVCFLFLKNGNKRIYVPSYPIQNQSEQINNIQSVKIAGQIIKVDLALTPMAREQGLSGRRNLGEGEGMLFVFDKPGRYSFWMKDMDFSIDMIWLDENLQVVYIEKNAEPESYPNSFTPSMDAKYVLEVTSGFSEKNNLQIGDSAQFLL